MAEAEIDAMLKKLDAAWKSGDVDTLMSVYTDDCCLGTNVGDIKKGKDKVRQDMVEFLARYASCDFTHVDREICGDCCTDMGTFMCKQKDSGTVDKGKYLACYVKRDGKWLVRFDISAFC